MDGLSVAASVAGLLAVGVKVVVSLVRLKTAIDDAPKQAQDILDEISSIRNCLSAVFDFLGNTDIASSSPASLLTVEQIVVSLAECVSIFSELEELTDRLDGELSTATTSSLSLSGRIKVIWKESTTTRILARLQSAKMSLNLILTTLNCSTLEEATSSIRQLTTIVRQILSSNQEMSRQLQSIESRYAGSTRTSRAYENTIRPHQLSVRNAHSIADDAVTIRTTTTRANSVRTSAAHDHSFEFEGELENSRVYLRAAKFGDTLSTVSSAIHTAGWSFFSGLSVSDVSNISVFKIPVPISRIYNPQHYTEPDLPPKYSVGNQGSQQSRQSTTPRYSPNYSPELVLEVQDQFQSVEAYITILKFCVHVQWANERLIKKSAIAAVNQSLLVIKNLLQQLHQYILETHSTYHTWPIQERDYGSPLLDSWQQLKNHLRQIKVLLSFQSGVDRLLFEKNFTKIKEQIIIALKKCLSPRGRFLQRDQFNINYLEMLCQDRSFPISTMCCSNYCWLDSITYHLHHMEPNVEAPNTFINDSDCFVLIFSLADSTELASLLDQSSRDSSWDSVMIFQGYPWITAFQSRFALLLQLHQLSEVPVIVVFSDVDQFDYTRLVEGSTVPTRQTVISYLEIAFRICDRRSRGKLSFYQIDSKSPVTFKPLFRAIQEAVIERKNSMSASGEIQPMLIRAPSRSASSDVPHAELPIASPPVELSIVPLSAELPDTPRSTQFPTTSPSRRSSHLEVEQPEHLETTLDPREAIHPDTDEDPSYLNMLPTYVPTGLEWKSVVPPAGISNLTAHSVHRQKTTSIREPSFGDGSCPLCNWESYARRHKDRKGALQRHIAEKHPKNGHQCQHCHLTYQRSSSLAIHIHTEHIVSCQICSMPFFENSIEAHIMEEHTRSPTPESTQMGPSPTLPPKLFPRARSSFMNDGFIFDFGPPAGPLGAEHSDDSDLVQEVVEDTHDRDVAPSLHLLSHDGGLIPSLNYNVG